MHDMIESVYYSDRVAGHSHHHYHDCHQILFIRAGEVSVSLGESEAVARAGDVVISNRFEDHAVTVRSEIYERYLLRLSPTALPADGVYSFLSLRPTGFRRPVSTGEEAPQLLRLFESLLRECETDDRFSERMQEMLVTSLLIRICRLAGVGQMDFDGEDRRIVLALQREFEENYQNKYTLAALADRYHVSVSALSHRFKAMVGVSVMEYLCSCRMAAAKQYLTGSAKSVGEIVESCGFSDCANFSRTFKSRTHMTPSEFRERYRNGKK